MVIIISCISYVITHLFSYCGLCVVYILACMHKTCSVCESMSCSIKCQDVLSLSVLRDDSTDNYNFSIMVECSCNNWGEPKQALL